jgi:hypothetical protein
LRSGSNGVEHTSGEPEADGTHNKEEISELSRKTHVRCQPNSPERITIAHPTPDSEATVLALMSVFESHLAAQLALETWL